MILFENGLLVKNMSTAKQEKTFKFTDKGIEQAVRLGVSLGMLPSIDGARQFLSGYFAAVENFNNPDESQRDMNTFLLCLLKQSLSKSTP